MSFKSILNDYIYYYLSNVSVAKMCFPCKIITRSWPTFLCALIPCIYCMEFGITNMEEEVPSGSDNIVTEFNTYEDFLDSQITSLDLYYLEVCMHYIVFLKHCLLCCQTPSNS